MFKVLARWPSTVRLYDAAEYLSRVGILSLYLLMEGLPVVLPSSFQSKTCERPLWSPRFSPASFSATVCSQLLGTSSQRLPLYPSSHTAHSIQKAFPSGKRHWTRLASSTTTWPGWGPSLAFPWQGSFIISRQLAALFCFSWLFSQATG